MLAKGRERESAKERDCERRRQRECEREREGESREKKKRNRLKKRKTKSYIHMKQFDTAVFAPGHQTMISISLVAPQKRARDKR